METWLSDQALAFLWAVALGGGLGAIYDWFRIGRILWKKWWLFIFFEDLLFALIAAAATAFCFTLTNHGQVRWFLLAGEGLGFFIYFNTVGVLVVKQARLVARLLRWIRRALAKAFRFLGKKGKGIVNFLQKPFIFWGKWVKMRLLTVRGRSRRRVKGKKSKKNESRP